MFGGNSRVTDLQTGTERVAKIKHMVETLNRNEGPMSNLITHFAKIAAAVGILRYMNCKSPTGIIYLKLKDCHKTFKNVSRVTGGVAH